MNKELQFLIYNTPHEDIKVDVVVRNETIWLTQKAILSKMEIVQTEGDRNVKRNINPPPPSLYSTRNRKNFGQLYSRARGSQKAI